MSNKTPDDLAVVMARLRNVLRKTVQSGIPTEQAYPALEQMQDLAFRLNDTALRFECQRWAVHLKCLRYNRELEDEAAA